MTSSRVAYLVRPDGVVVACEPQSPEEFLAFVRQDCRPTDNNFHVVKEWVLPEDDPVTLDSLRRCKEIRYEAAHYAALISEGKLDDFSPRGSWHAVTTTEPNSLSVKCIRVYVRYLGFESVSIISDQGVL